MQVLKTFTHLGVQTNLSNKNAKTATLIFEASAKELLGKDIENAIMEDGDFMRGKGTFNNSINPNAYPMTDTYKYPSLVRVRINGQVVGEFYLEDNPADHRGVLSWFSQKRDRKLVEAGTYGYLCKANIPVELLKNSAGKTLNIQFEFDSSLPGGLAIYGKRFGRYSFNPTILIE